MAPAGEKVRAPHDILTLTPEPESSMQRFHSIRILVAALTVAACGDTTARSDNADAADTALDTVAVDIEDDAQPSDAGQHDADVATEDDGDTATDPTDPDATDTADADDAPTDAVDATDSNADDAADNVDAADAIDATDTDLDIDAVDTGDGPAPLFDMEMIASPETIDCRFENHRVQARGLSTFDVWDVSFTSFEVNEGVVVPITLRGFAARPAGGSSTLPGIANVHGLGGHATPAMAIGPADLLGYFVIAATGPGGGSEDTATQSEGRPSSYDDGYRIFDVITDPRGSWLWAHAVGAMRSLTCLATQPGVDDDRLGITGFSAGALATLISASVDERIKAAVPLSGTGGWPESAAASASWFHALLTAAGLDTTSDEWRTLTSTLDPAVLIGATHAPVFMVNGSTDEFFPLVSHVRTYEAINPDVEQRTSIAANFDHGCFALTGGESAATIEERATLRAEGAQRLWFHHHFGTDAAYAYVPATPTATVSDVGGLTLVTISADPGGAALEIETAHVWASIDSAVTFAGTEIDATGDDGAFAELLAVPYTPDAIWFADIVYRTRGLVGRERFSLSTVPRIPPGHVPAARGITTCLP